MSSSDPLEPTRSDSGLKNLTGQTFGNLRVVSRAENYQKKHSSSEATWTVQCTLCGFIYPRPIRGSFLRGGRATGRKCQGCRGDRTGAPALIIDPVFVEKWTPLLCASIGRVIGFGHTFAEHKDELLSDVWFQLSKFRGDVPDAAMSSFLWQFGKTNAIKLLKRQRSATHHPTIEGDDDAYYSTLDTLTDNAQVCVSSSLEAEAFNELSEDEREFCRKFFSNTRFKTGADKARAAAIQERLRQRVKEFMQEVYGQQ